MRQWLIGSSLLLAAPAAAAQGLSSAYSSVGAPDAQACAEMCAVDGLCIAWSYEATPAMCSLSAVAAPAGANATAMGLSPRAPAFARERVFPQVSAVAKPKPAAAPPPVRNEVADEDDGLLGGRESAPQSEPEGLPIRSRLALDSGRLR